MAELVLRGKDGDLIVKEVPDAFLPFIKVMDKEMDDLAQRLRVSVREAGADDIRQAGNDKIRDDLAAYFAAFDKDVWVPPGAQSIEAAEAAEAAEAEEGVTP